MFYGLFEAKKLDVSINIAGRKMSTSKITQFRGRLLTSAARNTLDVEWCCMSKVIVPLTRCSDETGSPSYWHGMFDGNESLTPLP